MTINEYTKELAKLRFTINKLACDIGATYDNYNICIEQILNDALQGDLLIESNAEIDINNRLGTYNDIITVNK